MMKKKYNKIINEVENYAISIAGIGIGLFSYFGLSPFVQNLDKFKFSTMFRNYSSTLLQIMGFLMVLVCIIDIFWTFKHRKVMK
jgi:hypothetical protein